MTSSNSVGYSPPEDDFEPDIQENIDDFQEDDFEPDTKTKTKPHPLAEKLRQQGASEEDIAEFEAKQMESKGSLETYKGLISGATGTISRLIPGLKPEGKGGFVGEAVGSLLPIHYISKAAAYPLIKLAEKSPKFSNQLKAFAEITGLSTAGALHGGLEEATEEGEFKLPSVENMLEHGAQWAVIDIALRTLGWIGSFGKKILQRATDLKRPVTDILEQTIEKAGSGDKVAEKAIAIIEGKSVPEVEKAIALSGKPKPTKTELLATEEFEKKALQKSNDLRSKKIDQKDFTRLAANTNYQIKPYLPAEFEAEKIVHDSINEDLNKSIENMAPRAATEKELGENIQIDLENQIEKAKAETDILYEEANEVKNRIFPNHEKTATEILNQLKELQSGGIKLTPKGYSKVEEDLINSLNDLGYNVVLDSDGLIKEAVRTTNVPLSRSIEVKKRLNKIINYDLLETGAQDFLKKPAAVLREDIRQGYGTDTKARKAFEEAEKKFGEFAEKRGRKSITSMRYSEKPENIARQIRTPSALQDVKNVASPEQFAQIERELLEHMRNLPEARAQAFFREMRPQFSEEAQSIGEQILESKIPKTSLEGKAAQREKIKQIALDDISKSTITGERPEKALNLWKTVEGQQLIKNSLEGNPNKAEVLKYLSDQSLNDFSASVINAEGKVNFKKLNEFLKDKATADNIKLVSGEEGYNFLKNLETLSNRVEKNKSILDRTIGKSTAKERAILNQEIEKLGEQRLARIKAKNQELTPEQKIFESKYGKKALKERKETEESLIAKGELRFLKSKTARQEKERQSLLYKVDDLINSYGIKGKAVLAGLGIMKLGTLEGLAITTGYEIFSRLIKNKRAINAFKQAAAPKTPAAFLKSLDILEEELEKIND